MSFLFAKKIYKLFPKSFYYTNINIKKCTNDEIFITFIGPSLINGGVRGVVGDSALIRTSGQVHVSPFAPFIGPPIFQNPRFFRVAHQQHGVIHVRRRAIWIVVNSSPEIRHKYVRVSINMFTNTSILSAKRRKL